MGFRIVKFIVKTSVGQGPASSCEPGWDEPKQAKPSQALSTAQSGLWPGSGFSKAQALGSGCSFLYRLCNLNIY
jgi:hypothetical protein